MKNNINIELTNNLTTNTVQEVRDSLLSRIKNGQAETVSIDLSEVIMCDTSGIALLIDIKRLCHQYAKTLKFIKIPEKIADLANFYEVAEFLNLN